MDKGTIYPRFTKTKVATNTAKAKKGRSFYSKFVRAIALLPLAPLCLSLIINGMCSFFGFAFGADCKPSGGGIGNNDTLAELSAIYGAFGFVVTIPLACFLALIGLPFTRSKK
ncbi:hypothetical protein NBRC116493_02730 [Aurantivibrio infirmus]